MLDFYITDIDSVQVYRVINGHYEYITTLTDVKTISPDKMEELNNGRTMQENRGMESK